MRKTVLITVLTGICVLLAAAYAGWWSAPLHADDGQATSRLCVVWSSGDPGVAKNVCFMYTHNAKKRGWFD
ncbi:MAG: hypothetical protein ABSG53_30835, partial [Thermoguttaceae bacterium]